MDYIIAKSKEQSTGDIVEFGKHGNIYTVSYCMSKKLWTFDFYESKLAIRMYEHLLEWFLNGYFSSETRRQLLNTYYNEKSFGNV